VPGGLAQSLTRSGTAWLTDAWPSSLETARRNERVTRRDSGGRVAAL